MAKKKAKKAGPKKEKREKLKKEKSESKIEDVEKKPAGDPVDQGGKPLWKRMGLAVGVAIGIDAAFLPVIFLGFVINVIVVLILAPYLGAFVGARWLRRVQKREWIGSALWVTIIWATIQILLAFLFLTSLGRYDFTIELFGGAIIAMVYSFIFIFSLAGFYHGAEEEPEEDDLCRLCGLPCNMCSCRQPAED
jgi:hypothetical protein